MRKKVREICRQYFKYLKFICGPPCPIEDCPGAKFHADDLQRPYESCSSESEKSCESGEDDSKGSGQDEADGNNESVRKTEKRSHVISVDPDLFDPPYWCRVRDLTELLNDWNPHSVIQVRKIVAYEFSVLTFLPVA